MSAQGHDGEDKLLDIYYPKKQSQPKNKKIRIGVYAVLIFIIVHQGVIAFYDVEFSDGLIVLIRNLSSLALVFALFSIPLHAVIHELGHAFAGMSRGMKVILLSFGRWRYERTVKGFQWRKSVPIPGIAGAAALIVDTSRQSSYTRFDDIIFLSGGVIVNLLLGLGAYIAGGYIEESNAFLWLLKKLLDAFGFVGICLGVFNLLPIKVNGWCTDGLLIWNTLRGNGWELRKRSLYLASLQLNGQLPHRWSRDVLLTWDELQAQDIPLPFKMGGHHLRLLYALDTGDQEMAEKSAAWVAEHFERLPDGMRQGVALLMASFGVHFLKNESIYHIWRPLCEGGLYNLTASRYQLDAEYAYLCKDAQLAKEVIQKARDALLQLPTQYHMAEMQRQLSLLEERLEDMAKQE